MLNRTVQSVARDDARWTFYIGDYGTIIERYGKTAAHIFVSGGRADEFKFNQNTTKAS